MKNATVKVNPTKFEKLVNEMTKAYETSMFELLKKLNITTKAGKRIYRKKKSTKVDRTESGTRHLAKKANVSEMFLEALKQIGRPAMTTEIAKRYRIIHKGAGLPSNKKVLMQQIYNSASFLAKEGLIKRSPVGKRSYEYSL